MSLGDTKIGEKGHKFSQLQILILDFGHPRVGNWKVFYKLLLGFEAFQLKPIYLTSVIFRKIRNEFNPTRILV
jgi:hypothetical protein